MPRGCRTALAAVAMVALALLAPMLALALRPPPAPPAPPRAVPEPNGWDRLVAAAALLQPEDVGGVARDRLDAGDTAYLAELEALVAANQPALAELRAALALPAVYPLERELPRLGSGVAFEQLGSLRQLARLLRVEASLKAHRGDHAGAVAASLDCLRLGHQISRGAPLIVALVGLAIEAIGQAPLREVADTLPGPEALLAAQAIEQLEAERTSLAETLTAETVVCWHQLDVTATGSMPAAFAALPKLVIVPRWRAQAQRDYQAAIAHFSPDHPPTGAWSAPPPSPSKLLAMLQEPLLKFAQRHQKSQAEAELLRAHLALRAFHEATGRWPETLAELTPAYATTTPRDPYRAGEPLAYQRTATRYELTSAAPDPTAGTP